MKKEKGFTLIELLAVIVILAILMVIAVPKILNVINNSKKSAAESSIKLLKDAIKTQITSKDMMNSNFISDENGCYVFEFSPNNDNANTLNVKNKDKFTGSIKYCKGTFSDDTLKFNDVASNGDSTKSVLCKRATTLHTEECKWSSDYCNSSGYNQGDIITYGNLGTKGTLTSGDAFDCDVNGDGTYDPVAERFYYVTDMDDTAAVLIYSNNVSGGNINNTTGYSYDSSGNVLSGPRTLAEQLPTTSKWTNVRLINNTKSILHENNNGTLKSGDALPTSFSYEGHSARLLTIQELIKSCSPNERFWTNTVGGIGSNCVYLFENTKFAAYGKIDYWLENPDYLYTNYAWYVRADAHGVYSFPVSGEFGVRPVIEVLKTDMIY